MDARRGRRGWFLWAAVWLCNYGLYLLYAAKLATDELLAGVAAATAASIAIALFARLGLVHFRPTADMWTEARRLPTRLAAGTFEVLHALFQQLFSRAGAPSLLRAAPFDAGGDDAEAAARRALTLLYTTLTPNSLVLDVAVEQKLLFYHQVQAKEVLSGTRDMRIES